MQPKKCITVKLFIIVAIGSERVLDLEDKPGLLVFF